MPPEQVQQNVKQAEAPSRRTDRTRRKGRRRSANSRRRRLQHGRRRPFGVGQQLRRRVGRLPPSGAARHARRAKHPVPRLRGPRRWPETLQAHRRGNVALLRPLQVGIAIRTDDGRRFTWGFNLHGFDIASPHQARDPKSISYLVGCGVEFIRLRWAGIDGFRLRWLLRDSGLFRARPSWATFTGAYHVAYFVSMMFGETLPADVDTFMGMVRKLFGSPSVYDVKRLAREHDRSCVGSLVDIAKQLAVVLPNEGDWRSKPAERGSMLALLAFETLKQKLGANTEKYRDELCGIQAI